MDREVTVPNPSPNGHRSDAAIGTRLALPAIWMSVVVEEACLQIWQAWAAGESPRSLHVSPDVYALVAAARPGEVLHDYPLMLLGLPLEADRAVATYEPVVVRSPSTPA
jgi:hypothetical protein